MKLPRSLFTFAPARPLLHLLSGEEVLQAGTTSRAWPKYLPGASVVNAL